MSDIIYIPQVARVRLLRQRLAEVYRTDSARDEQGRYALTEHSIALHASLAGRTAGATREIQHGPQRFAGDSHLKRAETVARNVATHRPRRSRSRNMNPRI